MDYFCFPDGKGYRVIYKNGHLKNSPVVLQKYQKLSELDFDGHYIPYQREL